MDAFSAKLVARVSQLMASLALMLSLAVMAGYVAHSQQLITVLPGLQGMSIVTTAGIAANAALLLTAGRGWDRLRRATTLLVAAMAALILLSHATAGADRLSPFLAEQLFGLPQTGAGKTSVATAVCLALLALSQRTRPGQGPRRAERLAGATLFITGAALLGYAYGVSDLYALYIFNSMALHTALALFMLALAALLARTDGTLTTAIASVRTESGATRDLLLFALLPPVAGWILLRLTRAYDLGYGLAMALLVVLIITPLVALLLRNSRTLEALDHERQAQSELKDQLAADLQRQLAEQALALERESAERFRAEALVQRAQRIETVGRLTGGIAHNFNNLLMAVSGNLELLQQQLQADDPLQRYAQRARAATAKGAKLSGQLLAFSRIQRLTVEPVPIDAVLRGAHELFGNALGPHIKVEMALQADGAWVDGDAGQLEFAILNLAVNAGDAMPDGGILRIDTQVEGARVVLRVGDTGCGMTPEVLARAGEPFFTTKPQGQGTGLGLAQVRGVIEQCGGELDIASEPGQGTTVVIAMPLIDAPAPAATAATMADADRGYNQADGRPVLVIDDDDEVRHVLVDMLTAMGHLVIEAPDGPRGLALLQAAEPALALIDFLMPGMNGGEVARQARLHAPALPIIFISGYFDTMALNAIADTTVLRKPIDAGKLRAAIAHALQKTAVPG